MFRFTPHPPDSSQKKFASKRSTCRGLHSGCIAARDPATQLIKSRCANEQPRVPGCFQLVFTSAVPNTKLCACGEEDSGGHVLLEPAA